MQSEELSEGKLTDINDKSGHDKKDEKMMWESDVNGNLYCLYCHGILRDTSPY